MHQPKKQTPQQKRATQDSITAIKRADIVRKKDSIMQRNADASGKSLDSYKKDARKKPKYVGVPKEERGDHQKEGDRSFGNTNTCGGGQKHCGSNPTPNKNGGRLTSKKKK